MFYMQMTTDMFQLSLRQPRPPWMWHNKLYRGGFSFLTYATRRMSHVEQDTLSFRSKWDRPGLYWNSCCSVYFSMLCFLYCCFLLVLFCLAMALCLIYVVYFHLMNFNVPLVSFASLLLFSKRAADPYKLWVIKICLDEAKLINPIGCYLGNPQYIYDSGCLSCSMQFSFIFKKSTCFFPEYASIVCLPRYLF